MNYTDPSGHFVISTFLGVVAIATLAGAIDGGITAFMSEQDFWKGFAAGAIGGAIGGAINYVLPGAGNLVGRTVSTLVYGIANEFFQTGSVDIDNLGFYFADALLDICFSLLYLDKVSSIVNPFTQAAIGGAIDAFVDIAETELLLAPQSSRKIFNYSNETVTVVNYIYPNNITRILQLN